MLCRRAKEYTQKEGASKNVMRITNGNFQGAIPFKYAYRHVFRRGILLQMTTPLTNGAG